jgi:hypothetical protein
MLPPYNNPEQQQQQQLPPQSSVLSAPQQLQQSPNPQNDALISPLTSSSVPTSSALPLSQSLQQQQQQQLPSQSSISSPSTYPTTDLSTYNNKNNATDTNTGASNLSPHSTIKVTSIDQPHMSSYSQLQYSQYAAPQSSENHISALYNSVGNYHDIPNLIVNAGTSVILNGDSSHDPDGDPVGFKWEQISGPRVTLNRDNTSQATFIAPNVYSNTTMLFKLTVTDQNGLSDSKTVQITVTQQTV